MKYLVMECHKAYALVLSSDGKFLKVANRNYTVGQRVESVIELSLPQDQAGGSSSIRMIRFVSAAAASLLLLFTGWSGLLRPYGYIHMHINPDIGIRTNRLGYVLEVEAEDEDAALLLRDYRFRFAKTDQVIREIADLCVEQEFLQEGGEIRIYAKSSDRKWVEEEESRTKVMLEQYYQGEIRIVIEEEPDNSEEPMREEKRERPSQSSASPQEQSSERKSFAPTLDLEEEREEQEERDRIERDEEDDKEDKEEDSVEEGKEEQKEHEEREDERAEEREEKKDEGEEKREEERKEKDSKSGEEEKSTAEPDDDDDREEFGHSGEDAEDED